MCTGHRGVSANRQNNSHKTAVFIFLKILLKIINGKHINVHQNVYWNHYFFCLCLFVHCLINSMNVVCISCVLKSEVIRYCIILVCSSKKVLFYLHLYFCPFPLFGLKNITNVKYTTQNIILHSALYNPIRVYFRMNCRVAGEFRWEEDFWFFCLWFILLFLWEHLCENWDAEITWYWDW